jgi:hypothetical protein
MELNNFFSQQKHHFQVLSVAAISILLLSTCTEDPLMISPGTLPNSGLMDIYVDTIPVELYTVPLDAIVTKRIGMSPLGSVNDNIVGNLQTDFFADFIYSEEPGFKDEMDLDSIQVLDLVMNFVYNRDDIYGNIDEFEFNVYELIEPMPQYTKSDFFILPHMYNPAPLNQTIQLKDNTYTAGTADVLDTCQITLKNDFAQRFLDTTLIDAEIYHTDNFRLFKQYFKGFYVAVNERTSSGGAIIQIDHSYSTMTLRTVEWNNENEKWDTVSSIFSVGNPESTIDSGGVHLNVYRSDFKPEVAAILGDTENLHDRAYIQSLSGPQVFVKLPTLDALKDSLQGLASINLAQLILPIDMDVYNDDHTIYATPNMLGLVDGESKEPIIDFTYLQGHLGGEMDTTETGNFKYILNIENHLHNYLRDESSELSNSFYLFSAIIEKDNQNIQYLRYSRYQPERLVLNGSSSANPPFVRIVYSKIRE